MTNGTQKKEETIPDKIGEAVAQTGNFIVKTGTKIVKGGARFVNKIATTLTPKRCGCNKNTTTTDREPVCESAGASQSGSSSSFANKLKQRSCCGGQSCGKTAKKPKSDQ